MMINSAKTTKDSKNYNTDNRSYQSQKSINIHSSFQCSDDCHELLYSSEGYDEDFADSAYLNNPITLDVDRFAHLALHKNKEQSIEFIKDIENQINLKSSPERFSYLHPILQKINEYRYFNRVNYLYIPDILFQHCILLIENIPDSEEEFYSYYEYLKNIFCYISSVNFMPKYAFNSAINYYKHWRFIIYLENLHVLFDDLKNICKRNSYRAKITQRLNQQQFVVEAESDNYIFTDVTEKCQDKISEKSFVMITYYQEDSFSGSNSNSNEKEKQKEHDLHKSGESVSLSILSMNTKKYFKVTKIGYISKVEDENSAVIYFIFLPSNPTQSKHLLHQFIEITKIGNYTPFNIQSEALSSFCGPRVCDYINTLENLIFSSFNLMQSGVNNSTICNSILKDLNAKNTTDYDSMVKMPPKFLFPNFKFKINSDQEISYTQAQMKAINAAMINSLTLIQGPPGTGKTLVAVEIIKNWVIQRPDLKILVTADSNEASNKIYKELIKRNLNAFRYDRTIKLREVKNLDSYDIFVMTNLKSIAEFRGMKFERILIDESTQSCEVSSIVPISRNCSQLVLVGDHKQLPPTVLSAEAEKKGSNISLFERLINFGIKPYLLDVQFRMHPSISQFPNQVFYEGLIKNHETCQSRETIPGFPWPNKNFNVAFINVPAQERFQQNRKSFYNEDEIYLIRRIIQLVVENNSIINERNSRFRNFKNQNDTGKNFDSYSKNTDNTISIGVITPYSLQKFALFDEVKEMEAYFNFNNEQVYYHIDTVDGFQGQEMDLIIFSSVRANRKMKIGFLADKRRINVALTRAKRGLIVVGDYLTLRSDETWSMWFDWVQENKLRLEIEDFEKEFL